jgi:cytochrome c
MIPRSIVAVAAALTVAACTPATNVDTPAADAPAVEQPATQSPATEDSAIAQGRAIVEMYCADCHATGPTGESQLEEAPRFRDLHERYDVEFLSEALVEGIVTAHPEMPEFEFDPDQAEAIIQYLKSLEPGAP